METMDQIKRALPVAHFLRAGGYRELAAGAGGRAAAGPGAAGHPMDARARRLLGLRAKMAASLFFLAFSAAFPGARSE